MAHEASGLHTLVSVQDWQAAVQEQQATSSGHQQAAVLSNMSHTSQPQHIEHTQQPVGGTNQGTSQITTSPHQPHLGDGSASYAEEMVDTPTPNSKKIPNKKAKPFECGFCPKRFALKVTCKVHERVHTGEKPFTCKTCSRSFAQMSTLTAHVRIHSGEKPYQCRICLKRFRQRSQLTQHERGVHATSKPFSCDLCDKKFALKSLLKQHLGVHQRRLEQEYRRKFLKPEDQGGDAKSKDGLGRYGSGSNVQGWTKKKPVHSCPQCGRQFTHEGSYRRHERVHTGEQPYQCRVCGRKFADISSLRRHVKKLHPEALAAHTYRAPRVKTEPYTYPRANIGSASVKMEYPYPAGGEAYYTGKPPPPPSSPPPPPPPIDGVQQTPPAPPVDGQYATAGGYSYGVHQMGQYQQFAGAQSYGWPVASYAGSPQATVEGNVINATEYSQKYFVCQGQCVEDGRAMVECISCHHWFHFNCVQPIPNAAPLPQTQTSHHHLDGSSPEALGDNQTVPQSTTETGELDPQSPQQTDSSTTTQSNSSQMQSTEPIIRQDGPDTAGMSSSSSAQVGTSEHVITPDVTDSNQHQQQSPVDVPPSGQEGSVDHIAQSGADPSQPVQPDGTQDASQLVSPYPTASFYCPNCRYFQQTHIPQSELVAMSSGVVMSQGHPSSMGEHDAVMTSADPQVAQHPHLMSQGAPMMMDQSHLAKTEMEGHPPPPPPPGSVPEHMQAQSVQVAEAAEGLPPPPPGSTDHIQAHATADHIQPQGTADHIQPQGSSGDMSMQSAYSQHNQFVEPMHQHDPGHGGHHTQQHHEYSTHEHSSSSVSGHHTVDHSGHHPHSNHHGDVQQLHTASGDTISSNNVHHHQLE